MEREVVMPRRRKRPSDKSSNGKDFHLAALADSAKAAISDLVKD